MGDFKELQKESYAKLAKNFDSVQKRENRNHINKIIKISKFLNIRKRDRVLEIGVETGIHANYLLNMNKIKFEFIGVDFSEEMLSEAKKKLKDYKIKLQQMDGENLKFKDNYFDKVYISGSLHHFSNPQRGINEILRVLKKNGKFCIMEPNYYFPTNFYSAHVIKEEKNIKLMKRQNFKKWLSNKKINYRIKNFAYTPPFPKFLIPLYNIIDKMLNLMPILGRLSVMLFITGEKIR